MLAKHSRLLKIVTGFALGQGALQILQIAAGFALVRSMSVEQYGVFAFAVAIQATASVLCDLGLREAIMALAGTRWAEPGVLGRLVKAALFQRTITWFISTVGIFAAFYFFHLWQNLPLASALLLAVLTSVTIYFNGWFSYFSVIWIARHDMKAFYNPQVVLQIMRLALILVLIFLHVLDAVTATAVTCLVAVAIGGWNRHKAMVPLHLPPRAAREETKGLLHFVLPLAPALIFFAFQDQITTLILTIFGHTQSLAQAFALNRLGLFFSIFSLANSYLFIPWFARSPAENLQRRYFAITLPAVTICLFSIMASFLFPYALLFILGGQYYGLVPELRLAVSAAAFAYLAGIVYAVNLARRWIWRWSGVFHVFMILMIQAICITFLSMSALENVLFMSLAMAVAVTTLQLVQSLYGLITKWDNKRIKVAISPGNIVEDGIN